MSRATYSAILEESHVSLLPIINLHTTDPTALYSLLYFDRSVQDSRVTFDQELYLKAFEMVSPMKIRIFVRPGGLHQLMSFFGSIGKVTEGSGLGTALETVYTSVKVSHKWKNICSSSRRLSYL